MMPSSSNLRALTIDDPMPPRNNKFKTVIGSPECSPAFHGKACPCCAKYVDWKRNDGSQKHKANANLQKEEESDRSLPGLITESTASTMEIGDVIVEGWLHKKGSGQDWFGTTVRKPRWVTLALTKVPGYEADVPVLHFYWHYTLPTPTMSINLDSTVVMAKDKSNKECHAYPHTFDIIHVNKENSANPKVTRSFAAPLTERNEWIHAINVAMQDYEKRKKNIRDEKEKEKRRRSKPNLPISPRSVRRSCSPRRSAKSEFGMSSMPSIERPLNT